jgi:hypothetical protein
MAADATDTEPAGLSAATKVTGALCGVICAIAIGVLVRFIVAHDTWELDNSPRLVAKMKEADGIRVTNSVGAFKLLEEVLQEAEQHRIVDDRFVEQLTNAKQLRDKLYPEVRYAIQAEEAERQLKAAEEARLAATERERVVAAEERIRREAEDAKVADAERKAEEKRIKESAVAYRELPSGGRSALNAGKTVQARIEVGIAFPKYSEVVGEEWAKVKIFAESPEGEKVREFSALLVSAMYKYKLAMDVWNGQFDGAAPFDEELSDRIVRDCWKIADLRLTAAEALLSKDSLADGLKMAHRILKTDEDFDTSIRTLMPQLKVVHRIRERAKTARGTKTLEQLKEKKKIFTDTLTRLLDQELQNLN